MTQNVQVMLLSVVEGDVIIQFWSGFRSVDSEFTLSSLQDKVRECELCWTALHAIKSGKSPLINNGYNFL